MIEEQFVVPKFENEDEEAQWWFANRGMLEQKLIDAMDKGVARRLSETDEGRRIMAAAKRALAAREAGRTLIANVSDDDRAILQELAAKAGLDLETYVQRMLLNAWSAAEKAPAA